MRRLRVRPSQPGPPGASGVTARPNYMGPSGNGLVGADERGGKPAESRAYRMGAPVRFRKAATGAAIRTSAGRRFAPLGTGGTFPNGGRAPTIPDDVAHLHDNSVGEG